ncbi:MAG: DUF1648 domain-containing protein [Caulobacteraceae bacterium]
MNTRTAASGSAGLIVAMLVAAAWALTRLPPGEAIAIHYGIAGAPNGWAPASIALFILPATAIGLSALRATLPRITPRGANLGGRRSPTERFGWRRRRSWRSSRVR